MPEAMQYNTSPISLREGKVYLDGVEVMDGVACVINMTPEVWTGRLLGEITPSTRWIGGNPTGSITRRRNTPWLKEQIKDYLETKSTPEFTIQGLMTDENSDYYHKHGPVTITCLGCVMTGDLSLISLNSDSGEILDEVIPFNIKHIV